MKFAATAFVFALFSAIPAHGDASAQRCASSDGKAAGCTSNISTPTSVPEAGSLMLLGSGLAALGVFLRRKRSSVTVKP